MKSEKLLHSFGDIEDKYIIEARPKTTIEQTKVVKLFRKPAALVAAILALLLLAACTAYAVNEDFRDFVNSFFKAEKHIQSDMDNILSTNHGEYFIDDMEQLGNYIVAVVQCDPHMGQGNIFLYIFKEQGENLIVIDRLACDPPISLGVAVYKMILNDTTVVFGSVGSQVWLNPDDVPTKVDFTEVKVLYSDGKEQSTDVSNGHAFMFCLDGDIYIDDVIFLSGNEVVNRLSMLPISENVIEDFNVSPIEVIEANPGNVVSEYGDKIHTGNLRIATVGVGSIGCEYGVLEGEIKEYPQLVKLAAELSPLSLPRPQESVETEMAQFEFDTLPTDVKLFMCASEQSEPIEITITDNLFELPVELGNYTYFAYLSWNDGTIETVFFRTSVFLLE